MTIHCLLLTRANPNDAKKCDMTPGEEETRRAIRNLYLFTFSNKATAWQALNILRATLYSGGFKLRGGNSWMNFHCCHSKHFFSSSATLHWLATVEFIYERQKSWQNRFNCCKEELRVLLSWKIAGKLEQLNHHWNNCNDDGKRKREC